MDTVLTRTGDASALPAPSGGTHRASRMLGRLLLSMAQTAAERLVSSQRDPPPPEWYRYPVP